MIVVLNKCLKCEDSFSVEQILLLVLINQGFLLMLLIIHHATSK